MIQFIAPRPDSRLVVSGPEKKPEGAPEEKKPKTSLFGKLETDLLDTECSFS